jgi:UDP-N-acetylglucosamine acyltransferase
VSIHPSAVVHPDAVIADGVVVGPWTLVGPGVVLEAGVVLGAHVTIDRDTTVGAGTRVDHHVALGGDPQDRKHDVAVRTVLRIGRNNVFREFTTAHRGSADGARETVIGDDNYFMDNSHVAHDCVVGSGTTFANSAAIAGHVRVDDGAVLGGLCAVHQHCRVGRLAMIGGGAMCAQDVPPFALAQGDRARLYGLNIIGLKRSGMDDATVSALKDAWKLLFTSELPWRTALSRCEETLGAVPPVAELLTFLRASTRGVCRAGLHG